MTTAALRRLSCCLATFNPLACLNLCKLTRQASNVGLNSDQFLFCVAQLSSQYITCLTFLSYFNAFRYADAISSAIFPAIALCHVTAKCFFRLPLLAHKRKRFVECYHATSKSCSFTAGHPRNHHYLLQIGTFHTVLSLHFSSALYL